MTKLIALLAAAGLSGCVAYPYPYGSAEVYYGNTPSYGTTPYYGTPYYGDRGYSQPRYRRDRDRDGVPDRRDWDRDGDGVPNRRDAYPGDPRRY